MARVFFLVVAFAASVCAQSAQTTQPSQTPPAAQRLSEADFAYSASAPLDVQEKVIRDTESYQVFELTFASPVQGRVPAFLVMPKGKGPFAAVLFGHWGGGTKSEFLPEAMLYARAGAASLMIDYPWVRPAEWRRDVPNPPKPEEDAAAYKQAVIDLRRGLDVLLARPGVDGARVAYVGHSYGAQWGAILSALDRRIKAFVLMGGVGQTADIWRDNDDPGLVEARKQLPPGVLDKYIATLSVLDAIRYVPQAAPTPLLFQFANFERFFNRASMDRYYAAASQPKQVLWYDTGHDLNDPKALADRYAWLRKQIGLRAAPIL